MEIRDTKSVSGVAPLRKATARGGTQADGAPVAVGEIVEIAGIPEAEMTPKVRQAIVALLGEAERLSRELAEAKNRIGFLERLADEDALLPIANRRAFVREMTRTIAFAQRYGAPATIVYFDVNGLKTINDLHGHSAGDAALQQIGQILRDSVRTTDVVGRLGGDEFGVILVQTDEATASRKAESLAAAIAAKPLHWQGHEIALSAAFGTYPFKGSENATEAIDAADRAMYERKRGERPGK